MPGSYGSGLQSISVHQKNIDKKKKEQKEQMDKEVKARQSVPKPTSISEDYLPSKTVTFENGFTVNNPIYDNILNEYAKVRGIYKNYSIDSHPYLSEEEKQTQKEFIQDENPYMPKEGFLTPQQKQQRDYYNNLISNTSPEELEKLDSLYKERAKDEIEALELRKATQEVQKNYKDIASKVINPTVEDKNELENNAEILLSSLGYSKLTVGDSYDSLVSDVINKQLLAQIIETEENDPNENTTFKTGLSKEDLDNLSGEELKNYVDNWSINRLLLNKHADNPDLWRMLTLTYEDKVKAYNNLPTLRDIKIDEKAFEDVHDKFMLNVIEYAAPDNWERKAADLDAKLRYEELLDTYINNSLKTLKEDYSEVINLKANNIKNQYNSKQLSDKEIDTYFEEIASIYMPEYMVFKGDVELEDFNIYDKINYIATFEELSKDNPYLAAETLRRDMQRYISDNQGFWRTTGYGAQNILVGTVAQIIQTGLGLYGLGVKAIEGDESYAEFMDSKVVNLWNDIDRYNTFNEDELNKARKWGVSAQNAVVAPEEQYDIFTKHTVGEILKQGKYVTSMALTAGGASLALKGVGKLGQAVGIGANISSKTANALNIGVQLASQGFATSGMAQTMAKNTFDETLKQANDLIDQKIEDRISGLSRDNTIRQEILTEYFNSPQLLAEQEYTLQQAEKEFDEYIKSQGIKDTKSPKIIKAKEEYLKEIKDKFLLDRTQYVEENIESLIKDKYGKQIEEELASDREKAKLAAGSAASAQATISAIKEFGFNTLVGQWKFAPGNRVKLVPKTKKANLKFDNVGKAGAAKEAINKWDWGKTWLKRSALEFGDEWFDAHSENFSQGFGLSYFNDLTKDYYNPEAYLKSNNITYNFLTHINEGFKSVGEGFLDESGLYEAMIGALSGGFGANINVGTILFTGKSKYAEGYGKKSFDDLSGLQKFNYYITNGVISDILEQQQDIEHDKTIAEYVNKTIEKNGANLQDIHKMLNSFENELKYADSGNKVVSEDYKVRQGFELAHLLLDENTAMSPQVQKQKEELERLAKGDITEEDINQYINQPQNKNLRDDKNAIEIARTNLQNNAKKILDVISETNKSYEAINDSKYGESLSEDTKKQLVFNKLYDFEVHERLTSIEEAIQGTKRDYTTTTEASADFNSTDGYNAMISSIKDNIVYVEKEIEKKQKELKSIDKKDKNKEASIQLSLKDAMATLEAEKEALKELEEEGYDSSTRRILSKNEIMQLNPTQRAQMLDSSQKFRYKKKQQQIIEELRKDLLLSNPKVLELIEEAGKLYINKKVNLEAYQKILDNQEIYDNYVQYQKDSFSQRANNAAVKIVARDLQTKLDGKKDSELKQYLLNNEYSKDVVETYRKNHVKEGSTRDKVLQEIEPLLGLYKTAADYVNARLNSNDAKRFKNTLVSVVNSSNTIEEVMTGLELFLDNIEESDPYKKAFESTLQQLALSNYQRDSRVIEDRNKRQEELKKQREEEIRKKKEFLDEEEKAKKSEDTKLIFNDEIKEYFKDDEKTDLGTDDEKEGESKETKNQPVKLEVDEQALQSPSLKEQSKQEGVSNVQTIDLSSKDDNEFKEDSSTEYTGTPWSEFNNKASSDYHFLEDERASLPKDTKVGDYKKAYFNFIDQNGIKIQEIVDYELTKIFEDNPDVEVHFMMTAVNTDSDGVPFLVIEYTQDVAKHHKDDRGGVITVKNKNTQESKQWLIIGNAYSGTKEYIDNLINPLKTERKDNMSSEDTYYVSDKFTKIKEVKSGRLVKRQLGEDKTVNRSISELLYTTDEEGNTVYNEERNPSHIGNPNNKKASYTSIKWGIQKAYDFVTINVEKDKEIKPSSPSDNQGAVFMLIPTTNGKFMPAYINPIHYKPIEDKGGLRDGALKERIETVALGLLSNSLEKRKKAKDDLRQFLVFDDRTNIEIGSEKMPTLTVVKNGIRVVTYDLKQGANIVEILESLNPRINITVSTLNNGILMSEYEAAGALTTDISLLHTRNGSFTVFPIDANGNIDEGDVAVHNSNSETSRIREQRIPLNGVQYSFYDNAWHDENDNIITDANLIQTIEYKKAINGRTAEFTDKSGDSYHILSEDFSNPIVLRVDNKGQITKQTKEEANNTITRYKADLEAKKAAERAKKEVLKDVNLGIEEAPVVNPTEQLFGNFDSETKTVTQPQVTQTTETKEVTKEESKNTTNNLDNTKDLTTFESIFEKTSYRRELTKVFREKGWRLGRNAKDVVSFLESKGVSLVGIDNFDNWLDMIKNCK